LVGAELVIDREHFSRQKDEQVIASGPTNAAAGALGDLLGLWPACALVVISGASPH
jgi:hypothetical protein